jgi:hypothetical protein
MKIQTHFHLKNQKNNTEYKRVLIYINKNTELDTNTMFRKAICRILNKESWSLNSKVCAGSKITISASNSNTGIAVQTGNIARVYADLIKLCAMQKNGRINTAILLLPCRKLASKWGSNTANYERVIHELALFKKVINKPLIILGVTK